LDLDKNKILRIIAISTIFLILMLAFQWYFGKNVKVKALESALLEYKYVDSVEITEQREKVTIYLTLENIDNLMEAYNKICDTMKERLKGQPFELRIINKADSQVEDIFNSKVQFIIYEALKTGEFTKMRARLDEIENSVIENSTSDPLKIQVFLDVDNLYLHIQLNESNYYKIIKREV